MFKKLILFFFIFFAPIIGYSQSKEYLQFVTSLDSIKDPFKKLKEISNYSQGLEGEDFVLCNNLFLNFAKKQ